MRGTTFVEAREPMKIFTSKRLRLSKETLRNCAPVDLHRVAAGTGSVCYLTLTCLTYDCPTPAPGSNGTNCRGCMQ